MRGDDLGAFEALIAKLDDDTIPPPRVALPPPINGNGAPHVAERVMTPQEFLDQRTVAPAAKLDVLDAGDDDQSIPPRQWLPGNVFCRQFVSGLTAKGAGGKTSLRVVQALSLASDRSLTGEHVFLRCRALVVCLEDGLLELRRRIRAAMKHHSLTRADVKGHLFLSTPSRLKIARRDPKTGAVVPAELDRALRDFIDERKIDLVIVDPIKKAHAVEENSNDDMDVVVTLMAQIAIDKNVAFDFLSHERKSGNAEAGDADRTRGAGSVKDGGRLMYTLTAMTTDEQKMFNLSDDDRKRLFRIDSAKVNIAPPSAETSWFRLIGVRLDNGDDTYPSGDEVQTVDVWTPPKTFDGLSTHVLNKALERLGAGMPDGRKYSAAPSAKTRAAWRVLQEVAPELSEPRCRAIVSQWVKNTMLVTGTYYDEKERKEAEGILSAKSIGEVAQ